MMAEGILKQVGVNPEGKALYHLTDNFRKDLINCHFKMAIDHGEHSAKKVMVGSISLTVVKYAGEGAGITQEGINHRTRIVYNMIKALMSK